MMTSNLGFDMLTSDMPLPSKEEVERAVEFHFRPEFLNRLDKIIHFIPLRPEHMVDVVQVHFNQLRQEIFQQYQISLTLTDDAQQWLAEKGYDLRRGARPLIRLMKQIREKLGGMLIEGRIGTPKAGYGISLSVILSQDDDELMVVQADNDTLK